MIVTAVTLAAGISASLMSGSSWTSPSGHVTGAQQLEHVVLTDVCRAESSGRDAVDMLQDRGRRYRVAVAMVAVGVDAACPELGMSTASLQAGTVAVLKRNGWVADPTDGGERLYPVS